MKTSFAGDLHAPAAARRWVASSLDDLDHEGAMPQPDDLVLVVSELVTNSVRAGAEVVDVELVSAGDDIELHVTDDAPGLPRPRDPEWHEAQGRGLAIVTDVADAWHTTSLQQGKRITVTWSGRGGDVTGHLVMF